MSPLKPPPGGGSAALLDSLGPHDAAQLLQPGRECHPLRALRAASACPRLPPALLRAEHHRPGPDSAWPLPAPAMRACALPPLPSLFERLRSDHAPQPSLRARREQLRELVLRDLGDLLNACSDEHRLDPTADAAALASCCNFGIGALAGSFVDRTGWIRLELAIRQAIARFEPRIAADSVQLQPVADEQPSGRNNVLRFAMVGLIRDLPRDLEFAVRSSVDLETGHWRLQPLAGAAGAC